MTRFMSPIESMKTIAVNYIRKAAKVLEWAILAVLLVVFFILLSPLLPTKQYIQTYIISTGSMEPTIPVGTVAFTRPIDSSRVNTNDIIAFTSPVQNDKTIMHRVIEKNEKSGEVTFRTKGDNNNSADNWVVYPMNVKGVMVYQVPYIGHIVSFIKTKVGFTVAILIPALLLVVSQVKRIKEGIEDEIEKRIKKRLVNEEKISSFIIVVLLLNGLVLYGTLQAAHALFVTQASIQGINITIKDFVPPETPMLVGPADQAIIRSAHILFDWTDVTDYENHNNPVYYLFQLGGDSDFTVVHFTSGALGTSQTGAPSVSDGTYYWHVKACDAIDNCSDWSIAREITIDDTAPSTPFWIRPASGSSTRQSQHMLFDWTDSTDAHLAGYEYENRALGGSTWKSVDSCGLLLTSQIPNAQIGPGGSCIAANAATLSTDGVYARRVRAVDTAGNYSVWSDEWQLRKDATPPSSSVNSFGSATTSNSTIPVAYTASDSGSGVKQVELFYRFNGGVWQSYGVFSSSPITFSVPNVTTSGTYDFYTVAEDHADDLSTFDMADGSVGDNGIGNKESKTPAAEASIQYQYVAPGATAGDVVINELMWMGSTLHDSDEWIELRNMTNSVINLSNWKIENGGSGGSAITLSGTIPAGGYFLITAKSTNNSNAAIANSITSDLVLSNMNLLNTGEILTLKNGSGTIIDATPAGSWPAGINGLTKQSMERNSIPGDGTVAANWHTCISTGCNDTTFWDVEGDNYGTPKAANLSENDLSLKLASPLAPEISPEVKAEPVVSFYFAEDRHAVGFTITHIETFDRIIYELSYETDSGVQGAIGTIEVSGENSITRDNILLGTCSTAGIVCTYHSGITTLKLEITLFDGSDETVITQFLTY